MAHALVLGATGHIGAHVVRALLAERHTVRAAYRNERFLHVLDGLPVERVRVDLETLDGLRDALRGCEWVFHIAGYYPGSQEPRERAIERGLRSTRPVLAEIQRAGPARVVFTSSASTIRPITDRPGTEADVESWPPSGPYSRDDYSLYAIVKIAIEHEARRAHQDGLPVVITNPSVCLGEYDAHVLSGRLILMFAKSRLPIYVAHTVNAIYTGDVGIGHVRAAERGRLGERYLLTNHTLSLKDFTAHVAALAGVRPPRWCLPYRAALAAARMTELAAWLTRTKPVLPRQAVRAARMSKRLDGTKARTELALPQTPLEEAIRRALAWFRAHHYL